MRFFKDYLQRNNRSSEKMTTDLVNVQYNSKLQVMCVYVVVAFRLVTYISQFLQIFKFTTLYQMCIKYNKRP
jgi:hypothetical protein